MDPNENQKQPEPQFEPLTPTSTVVQAPTPSLQSAPLATPKPRKKLFSKFFIYVMVFLLGAVVYAASVAVYKLSKGENPIDDFTTSIDESADSVTFVSSNEEKSVTDEELAQYVKPVDCTTKTEFANLKVNNELGEVKTISLYDGARISRYGGEMRITWEELPKVVDYQCKPINFTGIKKGDRITSYIDKTANIGNSDEPTKLIQKATK